LNYLLFKVLFKLIHYAKLQIFFALASIALKKTFSQIRKGSALLHRLSLFYFYFANLQN
jgi:hypothetical protein